MIYKPVRTKLTSAETAKLVVSVLKNSGAVNTTEVMEYTYDICVENKWPNPSDYQIRKALDELLESGRVTMEETTKGYKQKMWSIK